MFFVFVLLLLFFTTHVTVSFSVSSFVLVLFSSLLQSIISNQSLLFTVFKFWFILSVLSFSLTFLAYSVIKDMRKILVHARKNCVLLLDFI